MANTSTRGGKRWKKVEKMLSSDYSFLLEQRLSPRRFQHSLAVSHTAAKLAKHYGADAEKAQLAGLLHDYARELPTNSLLKKCENFGIVMHTADRKDPVILHAPLGAELVARELAIDDKEIYQAIALHTTGGANMSLLDKIIYLADCIEPHRHYPGVDKLREAAEVDLDFALFAAFDHSLLYLIDQKSWIHPNTIAARNDLLR